jgi:hypothetical protein
MREHADRREIAGSEPRPQEAIPEFFSALELRLSAYYC